MELTWQMMTPIVAMAQAKNMTEEQLRFFLQKENSLKGAAWQQAFATLRRELAKFEEKAANKTAAAQLTDKLLANHFIHKADGVKEATKLVHVTLPMSLLAAAQQHATATERSVAYIVRKALEDYLVAHAPPPPAAPQAKNKAKTGRKPAPKLKKKRSKT